MWKRDTSSDEVDGERPTAPYRWHLGCILLKSASNIHMWLRTGHIASLALAHSLLAETDAERARIAATVCATVDYIVKGGLVYVDPVTGKRTTWGYWDP